MQLLCGCVNGIYALFFEWRIGNAHHTLIYLLMRVPESPYTLTLKMFPTIAAKLT